MVLKLMPSLERIRFVSSGTEAAMTAIRLARGVTGRDRIVKFAGCYHGHSDALLAMLLIIHRELVGSVLVSSSGKAGSTSHSSSASGLPFPALDSTL